VVRIEAVTVSALSPIAEKTYNARLISGSPLAFQAGKVVLMNLVLILASNLMNVILLCLGAFMILLILIQRGKGGGLAGAFGGLGGSSPFGSRAGDTFTRLTIYAACIWLFLVMVQVRAVQEAYELKRTQPGAAANEPAE
jgi:preprotein translocase subunit SecG